MIAPSKNYAVVNGNGDVVLRSSKAIAWRECKRRRAAGDVTAYVMLSPVQSRSNEPMYTDAEYAAHNRAYCGE